MPTTQADAPLVAVIVLNWNQGKDTISCLEHVSDSDYPDRFVLVIDNGSVDGSDREIATWISSASARPDVSLMRSEQNRGFAGGVNLGIRSALDKGARYALMLNNDARVTPETIRRLVETAEAANAALVGAVVLDSTGSKTRFAQRHWPWMIFGLTRGSIPSRDAWWPSAYADGCALLARADLLRSRLEERGYYFDERLFIYWEDVDLCRYGVAHGYSCLIARDAHVYHDPGGSSGGFGNPRGSYYSTRNRIAIANRWLSLPWKIAFHLYYIPSRVLLQIVRIGRVNPRTIAAVGAGLVDGYMGRGGRWSQHGRTAPSPTAKETPDAI